MAQSLPRSRSSSPSGTQAVPGCSGDGCKAIVLAALANLADDGGGVPASRPRLVHAVSVGWGLRTGFPTPRCGATRERLGMQAGAIAGVVAMPSTRSLKQAGLLGDGRPDHTDASISPGPLSTAATAVTRTRGSRMASAAGGREKQPTPTSSSARRMLSPVDSSATEEPAAYKPPNVDPPSSWSAGARLQVTRHIHRMRPAPTKPGRLGRDILPMHWTHCFGSAWRGHVRLPAADRSGRSLRVALISRIRLGAHVVHRNKISTPRTSARSGEGYLVSNVCGQRVEHLVDLDACAPWQPDPGGGRSPARPFRHQSAAVAGQRAHGRARKLLQHATKSQGL